MASVKWHSGLFMSVIFLCVVKQTSGDVIARRQPLFNNKAMSTYVLMRYENARSLTSCAVMCHTLKNCGSFFYNKGNNWCQLHDVVFITPSDANDISGTSYYKLTQDWCPDASGFVLHRAPILCYKVHMSPGNYTQAKDMCQTDGATLFKVKDEDISFHMYQFLRASSDVRTVHFLVGADDLDVSSQFKWVDGDVATWTNWGDGEPSHAAEHCLALAWFFLFKWNDIPCEAQNSFICQIDWHE